MRPRQWLLLVMVVCIKQLLYELTHSTICKMFLKEGSKELN